jgi:hypothetical protein
MVSGGAGLTADEAVSIGQEALIWLSGRPEALAGLLAASGLAPGDLRSRAADPEFLGFVIEFLASSDSMLLDFARDSGLDPSRPMRARAALPGGAEHNWT